MKIKAFSHKIYLKETFIVSYGAFDYREAITIELEHDGCIGYGEATVITYYNKSVNDFKRAIERIKPFIEDLSFVEPEETWLKINQIIPEFPFIQCAIDCALHSIKSQINGNPLFKELGFKDHNLPITNFTISIGSPKKTLESVRKTPWPAYKLKVADKPDVNLLKKVAGMHNSSLRLDANTAWPKDKATEYIDSLIGLPIDFIEQPFLPQESHILKGIKDNYDFVFIADESCQIYEDVEKCREDFDGVNIKLQKCGGITPAIKMIQKADELGLKKMIGCMTETSIGITYATHLLSRIDYADLDGFLLIKDNFADGCKIQNGQIKLPQQNGSGLTINEHFNGKQIV